MIKGVMALCFGLIIGVMAQSTGETITIKRSAITVRQAIGSDVKLGAVFQNQVYTVLDKRVNYYKIAFNRDKTGWVYNKLDWISDTPNQPNTITTGGVLNIRTAPHNEGDVIGLTYNNLSYAVVGEEVSHVKILLPETEEQDESTGWIYIGRAESPWGILSRNNQAE